MNPLGTVTTIVEHESQSDADEFAEEYSSGAYIHENCDESLFRPYVAVISGTIDDGIGGSAVRDKKSMIQEKPEPIGQKLIVPVIDSAQLEQQKREKTRQLEMKKRRQDDEAKRQQDEENVAKFEQMSLLNREDKMKSDAKVEEKAQRKSNDEKKSSSKIVMASKEMEKSSDDNKRTEPLSKSDKKGKVEPETVTVKLKKKPNKGKNNKSIEPPTDCEETSRKKATDPIVIAVADEIPEQKSDSDPIEVFAAPKPVKTKKDRKASIESNSSKGRSESPMDRSESSRNPFLMEDIERIDGAQCAEIQESLLKTTVSATVSIRKGSMQGKQQSHRESDGDGDALPSNTGKSGKKKKKWSKESIESDTTTSNNSPSCIAMDEFTYPDPSELTDADNLSFKSVIDDHIALIPLESIANDDDVEWPHGDECSPTKTDAAVNSEYDKLSDEAEASTGTPYADCKSFQLIIDEPETDLRIAVTDTNSSDETEDSSKDTKITSDKVIAVDDDEELQPLIQSTTSDSATAARSDDTLPNQNDSMPLAPKSQPDPVAEPTVASEPNQSQTQKQTNTTTNSGAGGGNSNTNNNKKKFRKKRR